MYRLLIAFLLISNMLLAQQPEQTYRNPVIQGDFPDPTVIRVDDSYYAAGTTSDFAPAYPLYHSSDLINWERIGSVFNEPPAWIKGDCWAPELFYNNGTYYVYYTARKKSDNTSCIGVATTKDITKGFTDHGPLIEWGNEAIDAYVFKDDDEKLYITWKAYGLENRPIEILASELSADGLSLVGEHFSLTAPTTGWKERGDEGQVLLKRNGYYYFFYSIGGCCDNRCDYRIHVARSKSLKGQWEQHEPDPILQGGDLWRCSGHGTIVQSPDGRYFYLYHAYHAHDFEFVGRQGLLDELLWNEESGWPYFKHGDKPTVQAPVPFKSTVQKKEINVVEDFSTNKYDAYWQWDMNYSKPLVSKQEGRLVLQNTEDALCFWGMNTRTSNYVIETAVVPSGDKFKGLAVYGGPNDLFAWGVTDSEVKMFKLERGKKTELYSQPIDSPVTIYLKIESFGGRLYRFYWSADQSTWMTFPAKDDSIDGMKLPQWGKGLRTGFLMDGVGYAEYSHFNMIAK